MRTEKTKLTLQTVDLANLRQQLIFSNNQNQINTEYSQLERHWSSLQIESLERESSSISVQTKQHYYLHLEMELRSLNEDILATSKRIHALEAEVEALKTEKLARVARLKALETHLNVLRTEQQVIDWSELKNFQEAKERMLLVQQELTKARSEVADKELDYSKEAGKVIKKRVSVGKKQEELDVWKKNLFEMKKNKFKFFALVFQNRTQILICLLIPTTP